MLTFSWTGMDPYENFALEYYLATEGLQDQPLVFLWRTTPGLMLGHYQNSYQEVKGEVLDEKGLFLVRRKSGGGTIYTDPGTIQYSVINPKPREGEGFAAYMTPLVEALKAMGYPIAFKGRNDLEIGGKKCSGHAQFRRGSVLVHHGSLLVQADIDTMIAASSPDPLKMASKGIASIRDRVANIDPEKTRPMEAFVSDLSRALARGAQVLDLSTLDWDRIGEIGQKDFASWEAIYGTNPAYTFTRKDRFAGGSLEVSMNVKKEVIQEIHLSGDYFAGPDYEALMQALPGQVLRRESLLEVFRTKNIHDPIREINLEEILCLLLP